MQKLSDDRERRANTAGTAAVEGECAVCGAGAGLLRCSRCRAALYCSRDHQRQDWPRHKRACRARAPRQLDSRDSQLDRHLSTPITHEGSSESEILSTRAETPALSRAGPMPAYEGAVVEARRGAPPYLHARAMLPPEDAPSEADRYTEICRSVVRDMNLYGLCVLDDFLGPERGEAVLEEVLAMYSRGIFKDGQLVSSSGRTESKTIRGDQITWIDGKEQHCSHIGQLIHQVDNVILTANRMANNGKMGDYSVNGRTKAMVACYPGSGTHYVKHVDNPNKDGRCITAIYYLNRHWDLALSGGLLRIFPEGWQEQVADIAPKFDRILFFWSDRRNPHEVQPAYKTRYAITLWYFDAVEREEATRRYRDKNNTVASSSK